MAKQKEFRWEYKEIRQGHYYTDIQKCVDDAVEASSDSPDLTVRIERLKPTRFLIATLGPTEEKVLQKIQSTLERIRLLTEESKIEKIAPQDLLQHLHSLLAIEIKMTLT